MSRAYYWKLVPWGLPIPPAICTMSWQWLSDTERLWQPSLRRSPAISLSWNGPKRCYLGKTRNARYV
jgi:hypothetical protein